MLTNNTTDNLTEGDKNLYYTEDRVNNNINVTVNTSHRTDTNNPHNITKDQSFSTIENARIRIYILFAVTLIALFLL